MGSFPGKIFAVEKDIKPKRLTFVEIYHKMELEKKRARSQKQVYKGPVIRYQSLTMPLIEEYQAETDINVETSDNGHSEG